MPQLVQGRICNSVFVGSNPTRGSILIYKEILFVMYKFVPIHLFENFDVGYINRHTSGRKIVHLVNKSTEQRLTTSYARYIMSTHVWRLLLDDEEVDHIDDNFLNDDISNLQTISVKENLSKQHKFSFKSYVLIWCPYCKKVFSRRLGRTQLVPCHKNRISCCTKECSYLIRSYLLTLTEEQKKWISENQCLSIVYESSLDDSSIYVKYLFDNDLLVNLT